MTIAGNFCIDTDFHLPFAGISEIMPFLNDHWQNQARERELDLLPFRLSSYPKNSPLSHNDIYDGLDIRAALDFLGVDIAVCSLLHGSIALHNPDMRAAMLSAANDYVAATWLDTDPRLRGSIFVSAEDPTASVAEIERLAGDRRFVQVLMLAMQEFHHGSRHYWPIYEAAEKHGLPIAIHAGSLYRTPPSVSGWPSYQFEDYVLQSQVFENILVGFLGEGVFSKFPDLKVVFLESGFAWLPTTLWRIDKTWRGVRQEVPWIDRAPSDIVKGRIFMGLQPADPPGAKELQQILKHVGRTDMLMFSTDYPHRQFDDDTPLPDGLPTEDIPNILSGNALNAYPRLAADPMVKAAMRTTEEVT